MQQQQQQTAMMMQMMQQQQQQMIQILMSDCRKRCLPLTTTSTTLSIADDCDATSSPFDFV
jgi:hypothetical protein